MKLVIGSVILELLTAIFMLWAIVAHGVTVGLIDIEINHYAKMVGIIHEAAPEAEIVGVFITHPDDIAGAIRMLKAVDVIAIPLQTYTRNAILAAQVKSTLLSGVVVVMAGTNVTWNSRGFKESFNVARGGKLQRYDGVIHTDRSFFRDASDRCARLAGKLAGGVIK